MGVYESLPPRRVTPALAVVLVLLAGLAGTSAFLVTRQVLAGGDPVATGPTTTGTNPAPPSSSAKPPPSGPTTGGPTSPRVTTSGPDAATSCPVLTEAAVKARGLAGGLRLLLYVSATGSGSVAGAEAWVCQNTDGLLIYQGHRRTGAFTDVCCTDTILLASGIKGRVVRDGNGFVATSPKDATNVDDPNHTDYHVSATEFYYVDLPQNIKTTYTIDRVAP